MHKVIRIRNLDCAACAAELSEELSAVEGVTEASADFINQRVTLDYEEEAALTVCIDKISHFEDVEIVDGAPPRKERHLPEIVSIALSAACFIPALVCKLLGLDLASLILFLMSFAAAGWKVVWNVIRSFPKVFDRGFHPLILLDENVLMTVAAVGAFAIGEALEGAAVMLLYQIGELLQTIAVGSSRGAITRLMELKSDTAILVTEEGSREVDPDDLLAGDIVLLRKGDRVPADCTLLEGTTSLDTKSITGEAYLREAGAGDELLAGYVNEGAAVKARVTRPSSESAVSKILDLVENSTARKAKPEKFITRFARIYTPVVVLLAVLIAVIPPLFNGYDFPVWIARALNFLVISCPCALIISVPLTYFSGVGRLAREGVLVKGAVCLDSLARVKVAAFDKTGTLTEGKFVIVKVHGNSRALQLAAAGEKLSGHPIGEAFAEIEAPEADSCEEIAGMGISCAVNGKQVLVGSARLMQKFGVAADPIDTADLLVYVAEDGAWVGTVEIADRLRKEAPAALTELKHSGIDTLAVLTGDTPARAAETLKTLPIDCIEAGLLPEQKPLYADWLKERGPLLYVGDGINDTPVLAAADVSAAMGGLGSDAAIETSDLVLSTDDLSALPKAVRGAKKTRRIVIENVAFSIGVKVVLMVLSLFGFIPLWAAVFGDVGVMLLAVCNALRMRGKLR